MIASSQFVIAQPVYSLPNKKRHTNLILKSMPDVSVTAENFHKTNQNNGTE